MPSPRKFVVLDSNDQMVVPVKCGRCAECAAQMHDEWYFRSYYEFLSTIETGGYVLFDTLTYAPENLPRLSRFFTDVPRRVDYPCFDIREVQLFMDNLRLYLDKAGYDVYGDRVNGAKLRYFLSSEYGTSEFGTHAPHYHVLFFCNVPKLTPLVLSAAVAHVWDKGRTDGVPWKPTSYVMSKRVFKSSEGCLEVCNYVSKYVQKDCLFQDELDRRVARFLFNRFNGNMDMIRSVEGRRLARDLKRPVDQFHLQSLGFGIAALRDVDLIDLERTGFLTMPDKKRVVRRIALPMYFRRKLYYEQVKVDGVPMWQPTDDGKRFLLLRRHAAVDALVKRYRQHLANMPGSVLAGVDLDSLADYVVNYRCRIRGRDRCLNVRERLADPTLVYVYASPSDRAHFGTRFVSANYLGMRGHYSYDDAVFDYTEPFVDFVARHTWRDIDHPDWRGFDRVLYFYAKECLEESDRRQQVYEHEQELARKRKDYELAF